MVHDLAADWEWMDRFDGFTIGKRGRLVWETAAYSGNHRVRIERLDPERGHQVRYVYPWTKVRMV